VATLTLLRVVFEWQQQPLITLKHLNVLHSTATNEGFYTVTSSITLSQMASKMSKHKVDYLIQVQAAFKYKFLEKNK
jgi:hypothetical protein